MRLVTIKTSSAKFFILFLIFSVSVLTDKTSAVAGRCYQCNSRNSLCSIVANNTLKIDGTPCNGQCYIRLNRDDQFTIYRGCSWEHGFMNSQQQNVLILHGNSVWVFCDTPFCNVEATALLATVCYQPICDYLNFPEDCKLPNADVTCGIYCNNKLCNSTSFRYHNHKFNRNYD